MMRNRWGVEVKTGDFVTVRGPRGQIFEGVVDRMSFKSAYAKAYGPQLYLVDGGAFGIDDVVKVVPKAKKNPLSRTSVAADSQRERVSVSAKGRATKTKSPSRRLMARRRTTEKAPAGFYANPLTRVKVNSPSMATGEPPSARLKKRRQKTAKGPVGVWANPVQFSKSKLPANFPFLVQVKNTENWNTLAAFKTKREAVEYANAVFSKHHERLPVRVNEFTGGAMK